MYQEAIGNAWLKVAFDNNLLFTGFTDFKSSDNSASNCWSNLSVNFIAGVMFSFSMCVDLSLLWCVLFFCLF